MGLNERILRLDRLINLRGEDTDRIGGADCQDVAEAVGVEPIEVRENGATYYCPKQLRKAIDQHIDEAAALAQTLKAPAPAPLVEPDPAEADLPADEPITPADPDESPADPAPPTPDSVSTDAAGFAGLDARIAEALADNGIQNREALQRYIASGQELDELQGIGKASAKTLREYLGAAG